jgi:hypothetical protein
MKRTITIAVVLVFVALAGACEDTEKKKRDRLKEDVALSIAAAESGSRERAKKMGMRDADTAEFVAVREYVCKRVVAGLRKKSKSKASRTQVIDDISVHACRDFDVWTELLRKTAKKQRMANASTATPEELRDHICLQLRSSYSASRGPQQRDAMQVEARLYECVLGD